MKYYQKYYQMIGRNPIAFVLFFILLGVAAGLLFWLFQRVDIPPVVQLRGTASVTSLLLLIAAGAGIAAMATVQFWKVMFLPRSVFHARELKAFFGESVAQVLGLAAPAPNNTSSISTQANSEKADDSSNEAPATKNSSSASPQVFEALKYLLDNPTEVVMGQLRTAADYIILRPEGFDDALLCLAGVAGEGAVKEYLSHLKKEPDKSIEDDNRYSNEVIVEVRFFVEQHLNLVHIKLKERWRRQVRIIAVAVAGLTGLLTVTLSDLGPMAKVSAVFAAVIWGGFFSWFARDIVALIERRRT